MQIFESYSGGTEQTQYNVDASVTGIYYAAQSFTPTVTHRIAQVRFKISKSANGTGTVLADVRNMENGFPTPSIQLASSYLQTILNVSDVSVSPTWYTFSFPSYNHPLLKAGTQYAIAVYVANGTGGINVRGSSPSGYAGGNAFYSTFSQLYSSSGIDLYFEEIGESDAGLFFCMG